MSMKVASPVLSRRLQELAGARTSRRLEDLALVAAAIGETQRSNHQQQQQRFAKCAASTVGARRQVRPVTRAVYAAARLRTAPRRKISLEEGTRRREQGCRPASSGRPQASGIQCAHKSVGCVPLLAAQLRVHACLDTRTRGSSRRFGFGETSGVSGRAQDQRQAHSFGELLFARRHPALPPRRVSSSPAFTRVGESARAAAAQRADDASTSAVGAARAGPSSCDLHYGS